MKVGIIGLGMLGNAVALHLLDSGIDVTVYNRTESKIKKIADKGGKVATSPRDISEKSDLLITIVKDAKAVNEISFGKEGIVNGNNKNLIVADMSTISPADSKNIAEKFAEHEIQKLDIPVMGGPNVAITGELVMMVSGQERVFERCKNIFDIIANKVFFLGENGIANIVKLSMNLQITMLALSLSEGITLMKKSDVDPKIFLNILNSTYFKTGMSEKKAFKMIEGNYEPTFTLSNLKKDISIMVETTKELGIRLPMLEKAEELYKEAINGGDGNLDYTGIINYIKKINKL